MNQLAMVNGLEMPADFPSSQYQRVVEYAALRSQTHAAAFENFSMAWNAIPYRFLGLAADSDKYIASICAPDGASSSHQRYIQERHLFGFFSNGLSLFECFFYAMFAAGSMLSPDVFALSTPKEKRNADPAKTRKIYGQVFAGDNILSAFDAVLTDNAYTKWQDIRNILSHRMAPGRRVFLTNVPGADTPTLWKIDDIPFDDKLTAARRDQASRLLTVLLSAAADFCQTRIT